MHFGKLFGFEASFPYLAMALSMALWVPPAVAGDLLCPAGAVVVVDATPHEAATVCEATQATVNFMAQLGLKTDQPARLYLVGNVQPGGFASSIGAYASDTHRIEVLSYQAAQQAMPTAPAFGVAMTPDVYRSFLVHEIAHAIAHQNFSRAPIAAVRHEYIAYTVQLATMPMALRESILQKMDTEAWEQLGSMSDTFLMMAPNLFAVKAYLHFVAHGQDAGVFRQILTGDF